MRRLACLLLPLAIACEAPSPDSGYPGQYGQYGGQQGPAATDAGSSASQSPPAQSPGSSPSPVWHKDAGSWSEPDAQEPIVQPQPAPSSEDAGFLPPGTAEDAATSPTSNPSPTGDDAGSGNTALLAECVGAINALRGQNDLFAYSPSSDLEAFAAEAAASDAQSGRVDGFFNQTGGDNVSFSEDEFDGAQIDPGASALQVLEQGLGDEQEGEIDGEGNLLSQQFGEVGCGVAQASDGSYWIAIEYR